MASFAVRSIDHVVLTVKSIPKTVEFYTTRLGMKHEKFVSKGSERHALIFGQQKLNLHQSGAEFEPKAGKVQPGSEDLCFITDHAIEKVKASWEAAGIQVRDGPKKNMEVYVADGCLKILEGGEIVDRKGAAGKLKSVYCRDPDDNLIEVSNYV